MKTSDFKQLLVWQKSIIFVEKIYRCVRSFPHEEKYALSDQLRRASISIPSNIAEGQARGSAREFLRFLAIAKGSVAEIETQLIIARRLRFLNEDDFNELSMDLNELSRMLYALMKILDSKTNG